MYMFKIHEQAQLYIPMELTWMNETLENTNLAVFPTSAINNIPYLREIIGMIHQHQDAIEQYSRKFKQEISDWIYRWLFEIIDTLNVALKLLEKSISTQEQFDEFKDKLSYSLVLWEEKYLEDFECWLASLSNTGLYLSKYVTVLNEEADDQAFIKMLSNARIAEELFFSVDGTQHLRLLALKDRFLANRRSATLKNIIPIDLDSYTGYEIIAAASGAVEESVASITVNAITPTSNLADFTGWHMEGARNGNWESITKGAIYKQRKKEWLSIMISYQHHPSLGNLADLQTAGVARYGIGVSGNGLPHILELFNLITSQDPEHEKSLAVLLLNYKNGDSMALTEDNVEPFPYLATLNNTAKDKKIEQLNRAAFLICFQESWRRKNQGFRPSTEGMEKVPELPFDTAIICALTLLADGHLRFNEVFDADADFGVFTGQSIMSPKNLPHTIKKFNRLFVFFMEQYGYQFHTVFEYVGTRDDVSVVLNPEYFRCLLKVNNGGESANPMRYPGPISPIHPDIEKICTSTALQLTLVPPKPNADIGKRF